MTPLPHQSPFSILPYEIALDNRLNASQFRVLIAVLSFRRSDTGLFWATREQIGERCSMQPPRVSKITGQLVEFGWLEKHGGGRAKVRYRFITPEWVKQRYLDLHQQNLTVPDQEPFPNRKGSQSGPGTVPDQATPRVSDQTPSDSLSESHTDTRRDSLFETVARECGLDRHSLTKTERGRLNRACKEIRQAGGDEFEVRKRARAYRLKFRGAELTPTALAANWSQCVAATHSAPTPPEAPEQIELRYAEQSRRALVADGYALPPRTNGETVAAFCSRIRAAETEAIVAKSREARAGG